MKKYIISLGGSLIFPEKINQEFLKDFKGLIEKYVSQGNSFGIVCGGGWIAREYQRACEAISYVSSDAKDNLGIEATLANALLLKSIFPENKVYSKVIADPTSKINTLKPIIVAGGWRPGWSTDFVAVALAENLGIDSVINMSNTVGVYDKDPSKYENAKMFEKISWTDYRGLIPSEWRPGMNAPFDPVASRKAHELGMKVFVVNGDLQNLEKLIQEEKFIGTTISS